MRNPSRIIRERAARPQRTRGARLQHARVRSPQERSRQFCYHCLRKGRDISNMATTVSTAVLKAVPLFSSVPEDQLRMLTAVILRKSIPRSTTVMAGGDPTDSLYIVLSGRLKVMMSDAEGKEVILTILGPGEFFGEMGLID